MHRKLASIDGAVAFVGGINIIDDYHAEGTHPAAVRLRGARQGPLATRVREVAAGLWSRVSWATYGARPARWRGLATLSDRTARRASPPASPPAAGDAGGQRAALVLRDSLRHRRAIEDAYIEHISSARSEIIIASAYFFSGRRFTRALAKAARRGVRVTLFMQGLAEFALLYYASWALYEPLLHAGVSIREYQLSLMHAKVAVFDRRVACVGSSNIDPLSLLMAREANVFVDDAAFAERLHSDLNEAMERGSTAVEVRSWTRLPLWQRLRVCLCYRCARLLLAFYGYDRSASGRPLPRYCLPTGGTDCSARGRRSWARRRGRHHHAPSGRVPTASRRRALPSARTRSGSRGGWQRSGRSPSSGGCRGSPSSPGPTAPRRSAGTLVARRGRLT
jgi:cardiolipin synthase